MYKNILLATDLNDNHFEICQQAAKLAKQLGAKLFLLHVIEPPASLQLAQGLGFAELDAPTKEAAQTVIAVLGEALGVAVEQQFVEVGSIKTHVLDKAHVLSCDLIIIGQHTHRKLPGFLDSTAHHIVQDAECDVLTIK